MVELKKIGEWSFIAGVIIAILMGVTPLLPADTTALILVVLGLIVGFINIGVKETHDFLVAVIALLLAGTAGLGNLPAIGTYIGAILTNITTFVAPAAVIVALKAVWELARKTG